MNEYLEVSNSTDLLILNSGFFPKKYDIHNIESSERIFTLIL